MAPQSRGTTAVTRRVAPLKANTTSTVSPARAEASGFSSAVSVTRDVRPVCCCVSQAYSSVAVRAPKR